MAWTSPRTWVASEVVTATIMNTHVRDNLTALRAAAAFTEDSSIAATKKWYLDGGVDTYLAESSANRIGVTTNGTLRFSINDYGAILESGLNLYLDGGGDTYLLESSANRIGAFTGGSLRFSINSYGAILEPTLALYLDGGSDTYITEAAANTLRCVSGGSGGVELTNGATSWSAVSDEQLKVITGPIEEATGKVRGLRAVIGRFVTEAPEARHPMLIAQDVQAVLPEAVTRGADGYLRLAYSEVVPLLVAAIQELTARVAALEAAR